MASVREEPGAQAEPMEQNRNAADNSSAGTNDSQQTSASTGRLRRASTTPSLSAVSSTANSPKPSRETSPIRPTLKPTVSANSRTARSRKNSQDFSPNRAPSTAGSNITTVPSAAAIQRALSIAGTPQLQPTVNQDNKGDAPKTTKQGRGLSGLVQPSGNPPRVKSPPPTVGTKAPNPPPKKAESAPTTPGIVLEPSTSNNRSRAEASTEGDRETAPLGMRTPTRGVSVSGPTLETVQENSLPSTPALEQGPVGGKSAPEERPGRIDEHPEEDLLNKSKEESGSESGGRINTKGKDDIKAKDNTPVKDDGKASIKPGPAANSSKPQIMQSKKSFTQLLPSKAKIQEGSARNMIVETETVSTIPQVALGGGAGERNITGRSDTAGSLRLKPSNETIRPKKDKKRVARKPPSLNAGTARTASSKADIFEAKVASAVDQTNSSDSEETFVYESNPPEPLSARPHRFHSRTPSATSMASQMDQYGGRNRQDVTHSIAGKKSMKFANNSYHSFGLQDEQGTVRGPGHGGRAANASHHHHIGRFGRNGNGHTSLFDNDAPFSNSNRQQRTPTGHTTRVSSRPTTPRTPHFTRISGTPKKGEEALLYDLEGEGADDERAPLMGSVRTSKNRRRAIPGTLRNGYIVQDDDHRLCRRITAWTSCGGLLVLIIAAVIIILYLVSKPLLDVRIASIKNVLASEQEIMLDLHVHAINPNIVGVQVNDLDINIFAKSKYVGSNALWRSGRMRHGPDKSAHRVGPPGDEVKISRQRTSVHEHYHSWDGVDEGTDPIEDPENDAQTMLLGRIFEFDSPLIFDPSPIRHQSLSSMGEVRLEKPGNKTEDGGTERWEKVILHDFELIVRGVIKYSLPISSRKRSASIGGRVIVRPDEDLDGGTGSMSVSGVRDARSTRMNASLRKEEWKRRGISIGL